MHWQQFLLHRRLTRPGSCLENRIKCRKMEGDAELGDELYTTRKYSLIVKGFKHIFIWICFKHWWLQQAPTNQIELVLKFSHLPPTERLLTTAAVTELLTPDLMLKKSVKTCIFKNNLHFLRRVKHNWYTKTILFWTLLVCFSEPKKETLHWNATHLLSSFQKHWHHLRAKKTY